MTTTLPLISTEIVYIPVKQLTVVWVQAQRPYKEKWAREIADNFDNEKFDPLIVTKPNGENKYHIVEGQHRRHAAEMYAAKCGSPHPENEQVPCRIVADGDPARAAEIWLGINGGRKAPTPLHAFNVGVVAGRADEVAISNIVTANGFNVSPSKSSNNIAAVGALRTVYQRHGRMTLANVLKTLRYLWKGDPAAVSTSMIRGFGIFINEFGMYIDHRRMVAKIAKWTPHRICEAAKAHREATGEKMDEIIAELLLREYNKGLKDKERLRHKAS